LCHNRATCPRDTPPCLMHSELGMECAHLGKSAAESGDPSTSGESMDRTRLDIRDPPRDTSLAFVCHPSCSVQGKPLEKPHPGKVRLVVMWLLVEGRHIPHLAGRRNLDHCGHQNTISRVASSNEYEEDNNCQCDPCNNLNMRESVDAHRSLSRSCPDTGHSSLQLNPRSMDTQQDMESARRRKMIFESHYPSTIALSMDYRQVGIHDLQNGMCLSSACRRDSHSIRGSSSEFPGSLPSN
jgi:hypothetical protein